MSVDPVVISFEVGNYAIAQLAVCTQTQCRRDFETSKWNEKRGMLSPFAPTTSSCAAQGRRSGVSQSLRHAGLRLNIFLCDK